MHIDSLGQNALVESGVASQTPVSETQYIDVVMDTIQRLDEMDPSMANHRHRTADRIVSLANAFGCSQEDVQLCFWAGMLHDIGKIIVPKEILQKREALRAEDWQVMRRHPDAGAEIVNKIDWLSPAADIIKAHHERYDGKGYPNGLGGESIPLCARILSVVDAFSAMVDGRIYRSVMSLDEAVGELQHNKGTQFDPSIVDCFIDIFRQYDLAYSHGWSAQRLFRRLR
jgi:putative nucleotidyltransferase with HDIG domain